MKYKILYPLFCSILIWAISTSNSSGKTGAFTSGCGSCHGSAKTATSISLTHNGNVITSYKPDSTYTVVLNLNHATMTASPNRAGFDLKYSGGTVSNIPSGTSQSGTEVNHTTPKVMNSGLASWTFKWKAPAVGTGNVTLNVAGNVTNGNNGDDVNDAWNTAAFTFTEATTTTSPDTAKVSIAITTGGNPSKFGDVVKFTATAINGGTSPLFQWKKNGVNIGTASSSNTYSSTTLNNKDSIWCILTSNLPGVVGSPASTNKIVMTILGNASIQSLNKELFDIHIENMILKTITNENKNYDLTIYNFNGSKVYINSTNNNKEHNISYLPKGIYFSTIQMNDKIYTKKFSIQ